MIDLWLSLPPKKRPSRIKPSSHVFVVEEEEEEETNIDVKRKSGCQRQLYLVFPYFFSTRKQIPATRFVKKHIHIHIHIHIHTMPSHPPSQISTERKTEPDEPEHSSIDPGEKASSDAENDDDDEKSTKNLQDGGRDAWLNVLGTHLIYISTWGTSCSFVQHS